MQYYYPVMLIRVLAFSPVCVFFSYILINFFFDDFPVFLSVIISGFYIWYLSK